MIVSSGTSGARPVLDGLRAAPWARDIRLGNEALPDLLDKQIHIAFEGDGPFSKRAFVPQTPAARELLAGPNAPDFERTVRGMLSRLDGQENFAEVEGISLSSDARGYAANWTMVEMEWEGREYGGKEIVPSAATPERQREEVTAAFRQNEAEYVPILGPGYPAGELDMAVGHRWLTFAPRSSKALLDIAAGTADAKTASKFVSIVRHELEHRRSNVDQRAQWKPEWLQLTFAERKQLSLDKVFDLLDDVNWLEEATAEVFTHWPGELRSTMKAAGVESLYQPQPLTHYTAGTKALGRILEMAAADPGSDPSGSRANELLQAQQAEHSPKLLADAIAQRHGLSESVRDDLRERIHHLASKLDLIVPTGTKRIESRLAEIEKLVSAASHTEGASV